MLDGTVLGGAVVGGAVVGGAVTDGAVSIDTALNESGRRTGRFDGYGVRRCTHTLRRAKSRAVNGV